MKQLPLTIVTAVLNEEKILNSFLGHATAIANEVIVVIDYRSTDSSPKIAKSWGAKVLFDKGESGGIVFHNKNKGVEAARNDWVMILDADERMDHVLTKEIAEVVRGKYHPQADIYQTSFINYEFGKLFTKSDQKRKPFVRLFRKGVFKYHTGSTAEGFGIQSKSLGKQNILSRIALRVPLLRSWYVSRVSGVVTLKGHLVHLSHPTIIDFIDKINHYSTREAHILFERNSQPHFFYLLLRLLGAPIKEFLYKFFVWKLYKEGLHGYIASVIYAFYHFLINAKYFRYVYRKSHIREINKIGKKYDFRDL